MAEPQTPSERAAADLEWPVLLDRIAGRCRSAGAAARLRQLEPAPNPEIARERAQLSADALGLARQDQELPATDLGDTDQVIARLRRGGVASGKELRGVVELLRSAERLRQFARQHRDQYPVLCARIGAGTAPAELLSELEAAIDDDGSVSDRASPELRAARQAEADLRRELLRRLTALMRRYADVLRDQYYAERDGRYVLPVRSDAHVRVHGIVLGSSGSGGTLYVEPSEITELGNRLSIARAEAEREEARVLQRLSALSAEHAASLAEAFDASVEADVLQALARFGIDTESVVLFPDAEPVASLGSMRHPLLIGTVPHVVPNDLELRGGTALIVSGPNAGGKTIALKALGLAATMARCGIPVPCAPGSRIGWFEPVLTDVGDDQSVVRSLSTFSAHVVNLSAILAEAGKGSLVLLDELAAGTDPEEGAALALAVLERLLDRGAAIVVTTHYERLKEHAHADPRFVNASVGFDMATLSPTFRLWLGVPGPSSALAVAGRFGIEPEVVARARSLLDERASGREQLLRDLHTERHALESARREAEVELQHQRELTRQLEAEREHVRERERARLDREGRELLAEVQRARSELRAVTARLRQGDVAAKEAQELGRRVDDAARLVAIGGKLARTSRPADPGGVAASEADLRPGVQVLLRSVGTTATVLEPPVRGQVRVLAGGLKLLAKVADLELARAGRSNAAPKPERARSQKLPMVSSREARRTTDNTVDLRGERVDEGLEQVERFIDRLLGENQSVGFVLHGHGTGALKSAVREHLASLPQIAESRPAERDEGGDAFTVFFLRD